MSGDNKAGVSYHDVAEWLREMEKYQGGHCKVEMFLPSKNAPWASFDVRVTFVRFNGVGDKNRYERGESAPFPSGHATTLAGHIMRLAVLLDRKLDEETKAAERVTQGRFGNW